jgi:hypothetical protein
MLIEDYLDHQNSTILKLNLDRYDGKVEKISRIVKSFLDNLEVSSNSSWPDRPIQAIKIQNNIHKETFLKTVIYRLVDPDFLDMLNAVEDFLMNRHTKSFLSYFRSLSVVYHLQVSRKLTHLTNVLGSILNNCSLSRKIDKRSVQYLNKKSLPMKNEPHSLDIKKLVDYKLTNHMKYFTCRKCNIKNVDFLIKFSELFFLDLTYNSVEELDLNLLKAIPDLKYVLLAYNKLYYINMQEVLNTWKQLKYLDIKYNQLRCSNIEGAKAVLRNLGRVFRMESGCR